MSITSFLSVLFSSALASVLFISPSLAQERFAVKDADLVFSYILPEGWVQQDDDYYHYILSPDRKAQISLTYFDGMCEHLDECYIGEVEGRLQSEYSGFELLREDSLNIGGSEARQAVISGSRDGSKYLIYAYFFIWEDQFFKIIAYLPHQATGRMQTTVDETVKSLRLRLP